MILLNGGYAETLEELYEFLSGGSRKHESLYLPFACGIFKEEEAALNGATTCVGVILPERIYEGASLLRKGEDLEEQGHAGLGFFRCDEDGNDISWTYTNREIELMERLNRFSLAH